ncbi:MAG: calcium-binding protein, partial [Methylococcales bacterium]
APALNFTFEEPTAGTGTVSISGGNAANTITVGGTTAATGVHTFTSTALSNILYKGAAGVQTITTGGGSDTITGGAAAADVISSGAGDDTLIYLLQADLVASNAIVNSIVGGAGTDTLSIGTSATAFTIASTVSWARAQTVETIKAVANSAAISITLNADAATAGITKVDISAGTTVNTHVVDVSAFTTTGVTIIGAASSSALTGGAGADTITGGAASDTIVGGAGADSITGGAGSDVITGGAGADTIDLGADALIDKLILSFTGDSITTAYDVVTAFTKANDVIDLATTTVGTSGTTAITFTVKANVTASSGTTNGVATGVFTFDKAAATSLADAITKVGADVATAGNSVTFTYGGNTYFYADTDGATTTTGDVLIQLSGVTNGNLTATSEVFSIA